MSNKSWDKCNLTAEELRRLSIIRRYASVAYDLPFWAQEALSCKMGSIEVSAKDSFEIYLSNIEGALPSCDMVSFQKKFTEIFTRKASIVLKKIIEHRNNNHDYYITNDYFWQEFKCLFITASHKKRCPFGRACKGFGKVVWGMWNKSLRSIYGYEKSASKLGIPGYTVNRRITAKNYSTKIYPYRWK